MTLNPPETGSWIKPLGDVFLGLNTSAVIRRVIGVIEILPTLNAKQIQGLTWQEFVTQYADEPAQKGLEMAWLAMAKDHIDQRYWPAYLPFKSGIMARLRPVEDDPIVSFVVHLSTDARYDNLEAIVSTLLGDAMSRLVRTGQQVFGGINGPLTDRQVKDMGAIVGLAEQARQLLDDLRVAIFAPAISAPLPHPVREIFGFKRADFRHRRVETHRLTIQCQLSNAVVYCQPDLRNAVQRALNALMDHVLPESAINITDTANTDMRAVELAIQYCTGEPELQVTERVEALPLRDPARFRQMSLIQRLVTGLQSHISPVNGLVWADTCPEENVTGQIVVRLPHWRGELPKEKDA
jgi:hypothetical protein